MPGNVKNKDENSCKSDIRAELTWKFTCEIREMGSIFGQLVGYINRLSNMGFAPLDARNRRCVLLYDPSWNRTRSFSTAFFYQYTAKKGKNTLVYESLAQFKVTYSRCSNPLYLAWNLDREVSHIV